MKSTDKEFKIQFKDNKGMALVFVVLIFAVVMIFTMSLITVSSFSVKSSVISQNQNRAHYLARAGAEAVKKAWQDSGSTKPEGSVATIYVNENYDFKLQADLTAADKVIATINASINRVIDDVEGIGLGAWEIISVAEVNGVKGEVRLTSTGVTSIEELNQEYNDNHRIINEDTGKLLKGTNNDTVDSSTGYEYSYITYHDEIRGTLVVNPKASTITFNNAGFGTPSNPDRHIAIIAQAIYFEKPIDLILTGEKKTGLFGIVTGYNSKKGALIVSGETIVFKKRVEVKFHEQWWLFAGTHIDYGLLMLDIPDGLGFYGSEIRDEVQDSHKNKIVDDERYGRVYFVDTVKGNNSSNISDTEPNRLSQKAFYFSKSSAPVTIGDLNNPLNKLIPMKTNKSNAPIDNILIPTPETNPIFFWK